MVKPKGGRGIKAPYETTHMRVPKPIKSIVLSAADYYRESGMLPELKLPTALPFEPEVDDRSKDINKMTQLELIEEQAGTIKFQRSEINHLRQRISKTDSLVTLSSALESARVLLAQKKSARVTVLKLLTYIYQADITEDLLGSAK